MSFARNSSFFQYYYYYYYFKNAVIKQNYVILNKLQICNYETATLFILAKIIHHIYIPVVRVSFLHSPNILMKLSHILLGNRYK